MSQIRQTHNGTGRAMAAPEHLEIGYRLRKEHDELDYFLHGEEVKRKALVEKLEQAKKDGANLEEMCRMMKEMTLKLQSEQLLLSQSLLQCGDYQRNISEKLSNASEKYEKAWALRQSEAAKFSRQLAMRRAELDEVISSILRGHPNFTSLMQKRDVLVELRDKYQAAKNELKEKMIAETQSQNCSAKVPDRSLGQNAEQIDQETDCEAQNSSQTAKNSKENGLKLSSKGPVLEPAEQSLQMNGDSCQEVAVNDARETAPSFDPEVCESEHNSEDMRGSEGSSQERCTDFAPESHVQVDDSILNWTLPAPKESEATLQSVLKRSSVDHIASKNGMAKENSTAKTIHLAESTPLNFLQLDLSSKVHVPDITPIPSSILSVRDTPPRGQVPMNWRSPPPEVLTQTQTDCTASTPRELPTTVSKTVPNLSSFGDVLQTEAVSRSSPSIRNDNFFTPKLTPRLNSHTGISTPPDRQIRPHYSGKEKRRLIFSPVDKGVENQVNDFESLPSNPKARRRSETPFSANFFNMAGQETSEGRGFFDGLFGPSSTTSGPAFGENDDESQFDQGDSGNFSFNFGKQGLGDDSGFSAAFSF